MTPPLATTAADDTAARRSGKTLGQQAPAVVIGVALMALVAATFTRLVYYLDSYGLTMLRLAVGTFLGWLALMTVLSVARSLGVAAHRSWLQSATVLSAAAVAVAYAWANPAAVVARVNLDRAADAAAASVPVGGGDTAARRSSGRPLDVDYLLMLGPDARGPLADFDWSVLGGRPDAVTRFLCDGGDASTGYGPFGWNRSRAVLAAGC